MRAPTQEGSHFVAVAAYRHGAPTAAMGSGGVIEEKTARGVGTAANRGARAFDEKLCRGTCNGGEKPLESTFACDETQRPIALLCDEFVVAFGDAKYFVDGFGPGRGKGLLLDDGCENGAQGLAQTKNAEENRVYRVRLGGKKRTQASGAVVRNEAGVDQKGDEFVPRQIVAAGVKIREV